MKTTLEEYIHDDKKKFKATKNYKRQEILIPNAIYFEQENSLKPLIYNLYAIFCHHHYNSTPPPPHYFVSFTFISIRVTRSLIIGLPGAKPVLNRCSCLLRSTILFDFGTVHLQILRVKWFQSHLIKSYQRSFALA